MHVLCPPSCCLSVDELDNKQITALLNNLSFDQKTNAVRTLCSLLEHKNTESPSSVAQNIQTSELVGLLLPHDWRKLPLCCDRWTSGLGHRHSLWQITRSQQCPAAHMEHPCWDWVLCNPWLTCLASTLLPIIPYSLSLSTVCHTYPGASECWKVLAEMLPATGLLLEWPKTWERITQG